MPAPLHPAIQLLVDEVRLRLKAPELPDSALRGALLEALRGTATPEGRLTPWIEDLLGDTARVICRRLGLPPLSPPSLLGLTTHQEPRDFAGEVIAHLLPDIDPQLVSVLKQLELRDARETQVAVRLGVPPQRVGVLARQARERVRVARRAHAGGSPA